MQKILSETATKPRREKEDTEINCNYCKKEGNLYEIGLGSLERKYNFLGCINSFDIIRLMYRRKRVKQIRTKHAETLPMSK